MTDQERIQSYEREVAVSCGFQKFEDAFIRKHRAYQRLLHLMSAHPEFKDFLKPEHQELPHKDLGESLCQATTEFFRQRARELGPGVVIVTLRRMARAHWEGQAPNEIFIAFDNPFWDQAYLDLIEELQAQLQELESQRSATHQALTTAQE